MCKHDANLTYLGKTKRHLTTRVREHGNLDAGEQKTSIASHIVDCQTCKQNKLVLDDFEILKQWQFSIYLQRYQTQTKIQTPTAPTTKYTK